MITRARSFTAWYPDFVLFLDCFFIFCYTLLIISRITSYNVCYTKLLRICDELGIRVLENHADLFAGKGQVFLNILPIEQNPAGIRHQQTVEMTDQGGFSASVFPGKHNEIISGHGQTNVKYACIPRTKGMGQMLCFQ